MDKQQVSPNRLLFSQDDDQIIGIGGVFNAFGSLISQAQATVLRQCTRGGGIGFTGQNIESRIVLTFSISRSD